MRRVAGCEGRGQAAGFSLVKFGLRALERGMRLRGKSKTRGNVEIEIFVVSY